jgi:lipopolysaccharide transport system ATP-binding protein
MSNVVIRVENLSKRYRIGEREQYQALRDVLSDWVSASWRSLPGLRQRKATADGYVWALQDVSFSIRQGEMIGIIGRNGAGKSTLLKILSRITKPTAGLAKLRGRVGSLLEVGTGFHPELTGRENIYLNGAVLGMRKAEIDRKYDEIVAFAEIEKFIDTPVKRYSSGMHMRLAFAVAAHLEPEILIVDEVLAVGDAAFQKKCLGRMGQIASEGRTVLFVSHNMAVVQALCKRGILLKNGMVYQDSDMSTVVNTYLQLLETHANEDLLARTDRAGTGEVRLRDVEISTEPATAPNMLVTGRPGKFVFHLTKLLPRLTCIFTIYNQTGYPVATFSSALNSPEDSRDKTIGSKIICLIDELSLVPGRYRINVAISVNNHLLDHIEGAGFFDVEQGLYRGRPISTDTGYGSNLISHRWVTPENTDSSLR